MIDRKECEGRTMTAEDVIRTALQEWIRAYFDASTFNAQQLSNDIVARATSKLATLREADLDEAAATYEAMRAEIEALRFCDNLGLFADNEMEPAQADAFREHLTRCERCRERLIGLVQEHATLSTHGAPR